MVADLGYLAQAQVLGEARPPIGNDMYGAFGRDFPTADGRRVMVVAISSRQWRSLVDAVEIGEHLPGVERAFTVDLSLEGDRFRARDALAALIAPWVGERTLAEVADVFDRHGVCWGAYQTFAQLLEEDWRVSDTNPVFRDIEQPGLGKLRVGGSPLAFSELHREDPRPAPQLGEHSEQILAEDLGLSAHEIASLRDRGIVAGPA
jgi:2-methylfumaryl-CoA isomerase